MYLEGLFIGLFSFLVIGLFHPIVIKGEYYFSSRIWPVFLVAGLLFLIGSCLVEQVFCSSLLGVLGFACFWSIPEIKEQEQRVKRGWFPQNPRKKDWYR